MSRRSREKWLVTHRDTNHTNRVYNRVYAVKIDADDTSISGNQNNSLLREHEHDVVFFSYADIVLERVGDWVLYSRMACAGEI